MDIAERIKLIRRSKSQDAFSQEVGVSKMTVGRWERGERTPDAEDLNRILMTYPEISPTWLLTGLGSMFLVTAGDVWRENLKIIRGNMTIAEFAKKMFSDPENWIATIQAIEDGKLDPDSHFLIALSGLNISLDWFFVSDELPQTRTNTPISSNIDIDLLKDIIREAELHDSINPGALSLDNKAELMAKLYAMRIAKK